MPMAGSSGRSGLRPATPRSFPMEREGSTRATSSSGLPSRGCNYSGRRSLRPACSSKTSGSRSAGPRPGLPPGSSGDRIVTVYGLAHRSNPVVERTLHEVNAGPGPRARVDREIVANPARLLPKKASANRQIGAFVPARYGSLSIGAIPISEAATSSPQGARPVQAAQAHACQILTTGKARRLLRRS